MKEKTEHDRKITYHNRKEKKRKQKKITENNRTEKKLRAWNTEKKRKQTNRK